MRLLTFSVLKNCKLKNLCGLARRLSGGVLQPDVILRTTSDPNLVEISPSWKEDVEEELRAAVLRDMQVYPDFITEREEVALITELEPKLRRMRYEFDHWDNAPEANSKNLGNDREERAIQGFRETERSQWTAENSVVLARMRGVAFAPSGDVTQPPEPLQPLPHVHVLDLAAAGHIKPHIDAVRFCGDVIAGLCLVSTAVMQLVHKENKDLVVNALLQRRGLYVMKGSARYGFTHAVLGGERSVWRGERVPRRRRLALICRTRPRHTDAVTQPE